MTFRFIHTADLHLDSPLVALALRDQELAEHLGIATRAALSGIVDLCLTQKVDALLIAGDLWDGRQTSAKTPGFLKQELLRLNAAGIRCFIIRGNHDAISKVTRELDPPPNTTVFGSRAQTIRFEAGGHAVAVHGLSFADTAAPGSLLPLYPPAEPGAFNIGMMHTSLNGSAGHDVYAPCALADLDGFGYDYWALGHIHRRAEYRGRATVVMPGIPQGRDIGEAGAATVTLVCLGDDGEVGLSQHSVASLRFERADIDLTGIEDWSAMLGQIEHGLRNVATQTARPEPHLVLRPRLIGQTPLAWRIARDLDRIADEAAVFAQAVAGLWLDRIENATSGGDGGGAGDLPDDLRQLILEDIPRDPATLSSVAELLSEIQRHLPAELANLLGEDEAAVTEACQQLMSEGAANLLAGLKLEGEA
ncbi:DNA repair exonuclease [Paracoccus sp. (in: a-proteobacteria)]|uniref:metallophosphoesterase family protein n=1 Tax=Paracoccus sp. TaxID=267 RepID=UPI002897ADAD|nr:DNA repair exonuclease [Paracoccus sp. (in: a-proteobacteria)]